MLGAAAIAMSYAGPGDRPAVAWLFVAAGAGSALAALRIGLPIALSLAAFDALAESAFGPPAGFWKEAFVAVLVARSLATRRASRLDAVVATGVATVHAGYWVATGELATTAWGAKILLLSVAAGWAVARLRPGEDTWHATSAGLAVAATASVVLGAWQALMGAEALVELGAGRIRETPGGALRVLGGFASPAAFSYFLVLALLVWVAAAVEPQTRRRALATSWLPAACIVGIALSRDRVALVGATAAVAALAATLDRRRATAVLAAAPVAVGIVLLVGGVSFLAQGFWFGSDSAKARTVVWSEYAEEVTVFGAGPGAVGGAYERARGGPGRVLRPGPPRTLAERVYARVNERDLTPSARRGLLPGVVDSQYLTWLVQYGVLLGAVLSGVWLAALAWPLFTPGAGSLLATARMWGVFLVVAAAVVNVWEETPTDLVAALGVAQAWAWRRRGRAGTTATGPRGGADPDSPPRGRG